MSPLPSPNKDKGGRWGQLKGQVSVKSEDLKLDSIIDHLDRFSGVEINFWHSPKKVLNDEGDAIVGIKKPDGRELVQAIRFQSHDFFVIVDIGSAAGCVKTVYVDFLRNRVIEFEDKDLVYLQTNHIRKTDGGGEDGTDIDGGEGDISLVRSLVDFGPDAEADFSSQQESEDYDRPIMTFER